MKGKRHGDVALIAVNEIPIGATKLDNTKCVCAKFEVCAKHLVLAHGEISGHAHRFDYKTDDIEIYEKDGEIYIVNLKEEPATIAQTNGTQSAMDIAHLEKCFQEEHLHAPIKDTIAPKQVCHVMFPQEFDWVSGEIARARD